MKKVKARLLTLMTLFTFGNAQLFAQDEGADFMRSIGNIYVVIAVIIAIFLGIVVFLIYLDRRLTKLEKEID